MPSDPLVAIIILNYNGTEDTHACVESCLGLTYPNYRIIVVDNRSDDPTVGDLLGKFPDVELLQAGENLGYAGGNNVGIRRALERGADYVLLLNNDTRVDAAILRELVSFWKANPGCGSLGCRIVLADRPGILQHLGGFVGFEPFRGYHKGDGLVDHGDYPPAVECDYNTGCALFTSREVLEVQGLLSEDYFLYWEDMDFGLRLKKAGLRNFCVTAAVVYHKVSASQAGGRHPLRYYYTARNRMLIAQRFFPAYPVEQVEREIREECQRLAQSGYWLASTARRYLLSGITDFHLGRTGYRPDVHADYTRGFEWRTHRICHLARCTLRKAVGGVRVAGQSFTLGVITALVRLLVRRGNQDAILCIVHPPGLGDVLATTPAIHALKDLNPDGAIYVLTAGPSREVFEGNRYVDRVIDWGELGGKEISGYREDKKTWLDKLRLAWSLRKLGLAKCYDFGSSGFTLRLALLSGARELWGYQNNGTRRFYRGIEDDRYSPPFEVNMVEWHLRLVQAGEQASVDPRSYSLDLCSSLADAATASRLLDGIGRFAVVLPHTRSANTIWSPCKFGELVSRVKSECGLDVVMAAGPDGAEYLEGIAPGQCTLIVGQALKVVCEIIKRSEVVITLNSGSLHIASAAGVPIVLLNGPDAALWLPWSGNFVEICSEIECRPCQSRSCRRGDVACMAEITVDEVMAGVRLSVASRVQGMMRQPKGR